MSFIQYVRQAKIRQLGIPSDLTENKATYKQMMQGIIEAYSKINPEKAQSISQTTAMLVKQYKRHDRIVWALRWQRLNAVVQFREELNMIDDESGAQLKQWGEKAYQKLINEMARGYASSPSTTGRSADEALILQGLDTFRTGDFATQIGHFISFTDETAMNYIKNVDEIVFTWEMPSDIIYKLREAEKVWQQKAKQVVGHASETHEDAEMIMDFKDGFQWWNLNQPSCGIEGAAMGHCGNAATPRRGDRVLSLRQDVQKGDVIKHKPVLTFILDRNDRLGEMKGRANEKPQEKYHPYILALLKSDWVSGIKGGGHAAHMNFSLNDLDDETRGDLIAKKPDLESFYDKYKRLGPTDEVIKQAHDELRGVNLPRVESFEGESVVLQKWNSLEQFYDYSTSWEPLADIINVQQDEPDLNGEDVKFNQSDVEDIFHDMEPRYHQLIADDVDFKGDVNSWSDQSRLAYEARNSRYMDTIADIISKIADYDVESLTNDPKWKPYVHMVVSIANNFLDWYYPSLNWNEDTDEMTLTLDLGTFMGLIDTMETHPDTQDWEEEDEDERKEAFEEWYNMDDEGERRYLSDVERMGEWWAVDAYSGHNAEEDWSYFTSEQYQKYADEDRLALFKAINPKIKQIVGGDGGDDQVDSSVMKFSTRDVAREFQRHIDYYESEEEDEVDNMIVEMKRRAGIL